MAKTKIHPDHRAAAEAVVASLAEMGVEATVNEVLLASAIANAVASIVSATILESTDAGAPPPDFTLARQLFDSRGEPVDAAAVTLRTLAIARGLLGARRTTASMAQQAERIGRGLVEMFAAMSLPAPSNQPDASVSTEQPERAPDEPRLRLKLDPELSAVALRTVIDRPDAALMDAIRIWMDHNAVVGDVVTLELVDMTDAEVDALPRM